MSETQRPRRILRRVGLALASLLVTVIVAISVATHIAFDTEGVTMGAVQKTATSRDGTVIAYEQIGIGPPIILVSAALADRSGTKRLANQLSEHFTVINYDRRGRGKSGDTQPYASEREVEDIAALIDASGRSAYLFGSSSGSVLALDAASALGPKVEKLFVCEPPFIVDDSRPPMPEDLTKQIEKLVSDGRRNDAVKLFFTRGMGIPPFGVTLMRYLMPGWSKMADMAHTVPHDLAILAGTQTGKPLPAQRWAGTSAPTLIEVGSRSEPFFHNSAKALAEILPHAEYRSLEGGNHGSVLMAPKAIATSVEQFFLHQS